MTDNTRDYLLWKHARGRYGEGGRHCGAKAPREGGILSPEYRATNAGNKNAQAMYRSHNGAVVSSAEPEGMEPEYTPIQMVADPFDKGAKAKAGALEPEMPEPIIQNAEAQDVYTPIACFVEGEPAPVR